MALILEVPEGDVGVFELFDILKEKFSMSFLMVAKSHLADVYFICGCLLVLVVEEEVVGVVGVVLYAVGERVLQ